ncbi:MAG: phosphoenolpyruvate-protein phosphotransferase, partial [Firmicutes bacterium]|nr:phosphoenolpyruvate-protein phosphotransferase [Bacillota bacterium]
RIRQLDVKQTQKWADDILSLRTASDIKKRLEEIALQFEI